MIPYLIVDPRSTLQRARRPELAKWARQNGIGEYTYPNGVKVPIDEAPAVLIRRLLTERGLTRIQIPPRSIGTMPGGREPKPEGTAIEIDADADLARQMMVAPPAPSAEPPPSIDAMSINELRAVCKARGIKINRGDTMQDLRDKLGG